MAAPKKPCPYESKEELEEAIQRARGVDHLAVELGVSHGVIRRWAKRMGASTNSKATGGSAPRENPYASAEEMQAALDEHGSIQALSIHHGVTWGLVKKWARDLGVTNKRRGPDPHETLDRMSDIELEGFISGLGWDRAAEVMDINRKTLMALAKRRNVTPTRTASPRTAMLARRIRELEQQEHVYQELRQSIADAADAVAVEPPPRLPKVRARRDRSPVDVILHVSDKQYGMLVDPDEVPGGAYSPDLYEERLERYIVAVDALLENTANANPIGTLWIAQGGDFVEGDDVFKGHAWHLAIDAGEQVVRLGRLWAAATARINARARQVGAKRIAVVSVVGNHGVAGGRSAGAVPPSLNYDFLTYEMVRAQLEAMPAHAQVDYYDTEPRRAVYFETCGGIVLMTHGEQDKGGGLIGVPVVTGMRNSLTAMVSTGVRPVLHLSGHFHRPAQISLSSDIMRIWSGPWVGQTNLSIGRGGASSPSQHMLVMHPEHGMIAQHVIRLTSATESPVEIVTLHA